MEEIHHYDISAEVYVVAAASTLSPSALPSSIASV